MKNIAAILFIATLFTSCKNNKEKIVSDAYADSLMTHYTTAQQVLDNDKDMLFWKNRIDPKNAGQLNESRYAGTLITRFHQLGDIQDVKDAETIIKAINKTYNGTLASPFSSLAATAMLQHRFALADTLLQKAKKAGMETASANMLSFDVAFELGRYDEANQYLHLLQSHKDYNYYFRRSKFDHYNGTIDSAISAMTKAADLEKDSPYLSDVALSNAGDLYIHSGDLQKAGELYKQCIKLNPADFHSIMGLGWVALVHDKNDTLAQRIFKFVQTKNKLPDPLFKLYQTAQLNDHKAQEKAYAQEFVAKATNPVYGQMYNKYVIEIYTGVLNQPAKAEAMAKDELNNRSTPATYAWYAYALFANNKKADAYKVFQEHVSGFPLEGLELYYMGKMMKGLSKGYNAREFFKAANKNVYDLSPTIQKDLLANLEE